MQLNVATPHVSGSIPTGVGVLTNLQSLELWHAHIIGTLPPNELGNLEELRKYSVFTLGDGLAVAAACTISEFDLIQYGIGRSHAAL
jgi:hypothetical protein